MLTLSPGCVGGGDGDPNLAGDAQRRADDGGAGTRDGGQGQQRPDAGDRLDGGGAESDARPQVSDAADARPSDGGQAGDGGTDLGSTRDAGGTDPDQGGGCERSCGDAACGSDGCGGSCGDCPAGQECAAGACVDDDLCPDLSAPDAASERPLSSPEPPGRTETVRGWQFTDDYLYGPGDLLKVGTRREWGSTVIFLGLSDAGPGLNDSNVIDANDTGREVQIALYDPAQAVQGCAHDASCRGGGGCGNSITYLGWNPVQGGNECNRGSGTERAELLDGELQATVRPLFWNPDWDRADCDNDGCRDRQLRRRVSDVLYTQRLRFVSSHVVEMDMQVDNLSDQEHEVTLQEFPTLYASYGAVGPNLRVVLDSEGRQIPVDQPANDGFFFRNFDSPGAFVVLQNDDRSYGVGIYYENRQTGYQAWQRDGMFNNVRARFSFGLAAHGSVRARAYIVLGNFATVAGEVAALDGRLPPFGWLDEPSPDAEVQGEVRLRGWALDNHGVQRVEALLDGAPLGDLPTGGARPDVCRVWPGYAGCERSGFDGVVSLAGVGPCWHLLEIRAVDSHGNARVIARQRVRVPGAPG